MELIVQKTNNDCALAAMAMALGKTYDEAWTAEDLAAVVESKGVANFRPWLEKHGLTERVDYIEVYTDSYRLAFVHAMLWGRRAILSVHSINNDHGHHAVYWDGSKLWDPNNRARIPFLSSCIVTRALLFK